MCQRPKRAFSISTARSEDPAKIIYFGVNALNGLFPFLQWILDLERFLSELCVNALNGLFPFLQCGIIDL